jgi:hypothetical protein
LNFYSEIKESKLIKIMSKILYSINEAIRKLEIISPSIIARTANLPNDRSGFSAFDTNNSGGIDQKELKGAINFYTTVSKNRGEDYYELSPFAEPELFNFIASLSGNKEIEKEDFSALKSRASTLLNNSSNNSYSGYFPKDQSTEEAKQVFDRSIKELMNLAVQLPNSPRVNGKRNDEPNNRS